jgi:hypothetical protein
MDWQTVAFIAALCALSSYFIKDFLVNPVMIIFVYPILLFCSILAHHAILGMEIYSPKKFDQWVMWTILASICGNFVGIGLVACFARVRERLGSRTA